MIPQLSREIKQFNLRGFVSFFCALLAWSHSDGPGLSRRQGTGLLTACFHDAVCLLVCPELKVARPIPRLADLPRHPRHAKVIEDLDVGRDLVRLCLTRCPKLFKQCQLVCLERTLQCDWAFVSELVYAAVRMQVHNVEGRTGPVLWDVRVWELVASAWTCYIVSFQRFSWIYEHEPYRLISEPHCLP